MALLDAYLWIKIPGASDGSCNRGVTGSTTDPEWGGIVDPAAVAWFPQMALDLVHNANPAFHVQRVALEISDAIELASLDRRRRSRGRGSTW